MMENPKTHAFAILAPVPEQHLISAQEAIAAQLAADPPETPPVLAYGSKAFEVFRKADEERAGHPVEIFIYASHAKEQTLKPQATWKATYIKHVDSRRGRYPGKAYHRPPSTEQDKQDYWAVYWLVQDLEKLATPIPISDFRGYDKKADYLTNFVPEGPLLVAHPQP